MNPALVDVRKLGLSLGLGRSTAPSGHMWRTIQRLVRFACVTARLDHLQHCRPALTRSLGVQR